MSLWGRLQYYFICVEHFTQKILKIIDDEHNLNDYNTNNFNMDNNEIKDNNKPSKKFMAMLMGFMDGDGYFDIGEQKQYKKNKELARSTIRIRFATNVHVRDLPLLEYFISVLKVGKISKMSGSRDQVRIIFSKNDLISVLLPLIKEYNLEFLTHQRKKQFALLNYILDNSIIH